MQQADLATEQEHQMTMGGYVEQSGLSNLTIVGFFVLRRSSSNNVIVLLQNQPINNRGSTLFNSKGVSMATEAQPTSKAAFQGCNCDQLVANATQSCDWNFPASCQLATDHEVFQPCDQKSHALFQLKNERTIPIKLPTQYLNCVQGKISKQRQTLHFSMILCCHS